MTQSKKMFRSPEEYKKEAKKLLTARVDGKVLEGLEKIAASKDISLSELVAGILEDYMEWHRERKSHG